MFTIERKMQKGLGRAGKLETAHGTIHTPAFVTVGTKATVKALTPVQVRDVGAEVVLGNTYHLYLEPGENIIKEAGGFGKFMGWDGPTMTDSGGFQVFSLGESLGHSVSKVAKGTPLKVSTPNSPRSTSDVGRMNITETSGKAPLVRIDEDGVTFRSYRDGSRHRFTPERSIEIQHNIGADIIFAFDECTSPTASYEYQREAMDRTHRWAARSLVRHQSLDRARDKDSLPQAIFGIVQGGRFQDLRKASANVIGAMEFDGFGIGGSFDKEDMGTAVRWVNELLPEEKPKHLLGIGDPLDLFGAVENGCDLFDCVAPTRQARTGSLYTRHGRFNIENARYKNDFSPIDVECDCYTCTHFTKAYLAHLFRSDELLANTLASIHNVYFIVHLVKHMREGILDGTFNEQKEEFFRKYASNN